MVKPMRKPVGKRINRKQFIESHGATCRNWRWSWSFVNHRDQMAIFGTWDIYASPHGDLILDEQWEWNARAGRKALGYRESLEHIRLVERGGYQLKIFRMIYEGENRDDRVSGPAVIAGIVPTLKTKQLKKVGHAWYAVD